MNNYRVLKIPNRIEGDFDQAFTSESLAECIDYVRSLDAKEYDYHYIVEDVGYPVSYGKTIGIKARGDVWFNA